MIKSDDSDCFYMIESITNDFLLRAVGNWASHSSDT